MTTGLGPGAAEGPPPPAAPRPFFWSGEDETRAGLPPAEPPETELPDRSWTILHQPDRGVPREDRAPSLRRILIQLGMAGAVVLVIVGLAGAAISRRLAEQQSVHDAAQLTDVLAEGVFRPALTDAMSRDPAATAALDAIVRRGVLSDSLVRVKIWAPSGRIMYSDERRLIGASFALDDEAQSSLTESRAEASVSDLQRPENTYERSQGKLLEVYRPIWTPSGTPLLLETYFRYDTVSARSHDLWRGFFGIMVSSLAAVLLLMLALIWTLVNRVRREQTRREAAMRRSLDASADERRRIAADLHDGVVQQLAATSFAISAGAQRAAIAGDHELQQSLDSTASTVRSTMVGLRSLLVDIYPASLTSAGLSAALHDLTGTMSGRGVQLTVAVAPGLDDRLDQDSREAIFRVAQEALRNAVRHAAATAVTISVDIVAAEPAGHPLHRDIARLIVADDGHGMPGTAAAPAGREDHFGMRLMTDIAVRTHSTLALRSAPGAGTELRMDVTLA